MDGSVAVAGEMNEVVVIYKFSSRKYGIYTAMSRLPYFPVIKHMRLYLHRKKTYA